MNYDTIIIGGGLSGLTCGIALSRAGQRVAIVAGGQNTLHFFGGSMELLGNVGGLEVTHPLDAIASLPAGHPYAKLGSARVGELAAAAKELLASASIVTTGDASANHYRITPIGVTKPAWLTLEGFATATETGRLPWSHVCLLNIDGFIDYPIDFVADGLRRLGATVDVAPITLEATQRARRSATEMRATSLARVLNNTATTTQLAQAINALDTHADVVLLPAVLGIDSDDVRRMLAAQVSRPLLLLATLPPSVPGVRITAALRHYFQMLGGRYLLGDTVCRATIDGDRLTEVHTTKLQSMPLRAKHFVMATGSFISRGLTSTYEGISEPLLGLDVDVPASRDAWSHYGMMGDQPYMSIGVITDDTLHPLRGGQPMTNVVAIGQLLSGHNPVAMGDGTGVSMITALAAAQAISATTAPVNPTH